MAPPRTRKASAKAKAAETTKRTTITKAKTTCKPPSSFRAPITSPREPTPSPPPTLENLNDAVNSLSADTQDCIEQLRESITHVAEETNSSIASINDRLEALTAALSANLQPKLTLNGGTGANGKNPLPFLQSHLPWIDQSTLTNLVSGKMEVKDLLRLIPAEDRPRGRTTAIPGSISFDSQTGLKWVPPDDAPTTFDKDFPDFNTCLYTLTVYLAVRTLYDVDNTGIGPAIALYIKQLTRWVLIDKFSWHHVRAYFVSHFRKYQTSTDPLSWINIDIQLFTAHIRPSGTSNIPSSTSCPPGKKPPKETAICINWNTQGKGCNWGQCARLHHCSTCGSTEHPSYKCKTKQEPKS